MSLDTKIADRIRKLLTMADRSTNEHEAGLAAARAAKMMSDFQISEAMLRIVDDPRPAEAIIKGSLEGTNIAGKRVAWKHAISTAVAFSLGCKSWFHGGAACVLGRDSAVQSWSYTCQYLLREIDRLAKERWEVERDAATEHGHSARGWCNAFRVGAAQAVARRLRDQTRESKASRRADVAAAAAAAMTGPDSANQTGRETMAMAVLDRDEQEVESRYAEMSKGWRSSAAIGQVSVRTGYHAGREAGAAIRLGGGRGGLPEGRRSIRS